MDHSKQFHPHRQSQSEANIVPQSTQISKVYEQLSFALDRHAETIWILNVGDLKPYEMSIEFFFTYGWNSSVWSYDNLDSFVSLWAQREFDLDVSDANEVSAIIANVTRWNARRKPELLNSTTFSLTDYRECVIIIGSLSLSLYPLIIDFRAENVVSNWQNLVTVSTNIYNKLPSDMKAAYFELVQHPVLASATLGQMWVYAGQNSVRASQARLSANNLADQVESLFEQDYDLEYQYHTLLDGMFIQPNASLFDSCFNYHREMGSVRSSSYLNLGGFLIIPKHDGPDPRYVLLLATTNDEYVSSFLLLTSIFIISVWQNATYLSRGHQETSSSWRYAYSS